MCWGSENVPIMKDAFGQKDILKRSYVHLMPILWWNFEKQCIIQKGNSRSLTFCSFGMVYADYISFSQFLYVNIYNTQHEFLPILINAANFTSILTEKFSLISPP